jgi:hypothetical protein
MKAFVDIVGEVAHAAFGAFLRTTLAMLGLGVVLGGVAYFIASGSTLYGVFAALFAFIVSAVLGVILAGKRAVAQGIAQGVDRLDLGGAAVRYLFDKPLGILAAGAVSQHGRLVARTVERLPLAQAEARLAEVANKLVRASSAETGLRGWLRQQLQGRLLRLVQHLTLARFRQTGSSTTGVDLVGVRNELVTRVNDLLAAKLQRGIQVTTVLYLLLAIVLSLLAAFALQQLPS